MTGDENIHEDPWNVTGQTADNAQASQETSFQHVRSPYISSDDLGTASMVFGILSFFFYKGLFAVLGLVLGIISVKRHRNDHAVVGIVCSVINLVLMFVTLVVIIIAVFSLLSSLSRFLTDYLPF